MITFIVLLMMKHVLQDRNCLHNVENLVDFYRNLRTISVLRDETHHRGYYGPLWYVFCDGISRGRFLIYLTSLA